MSVERLERVMWRLRKRNPNNLKITINELQRAIMYECGTDPRTYSNNKRSLIRLGWIRSRGPRHVWLTGNDLTGDDD